MLDVGCGWGALLDRFVRAHGAAGGVGLTLSPAQVDVAAARGVPSVDYRLEHWADHEPAAPYDAITCIEATEHFASDALDADAKVDVYRAFFERCAGWLRPGGRVGLQLICLDDVGHDGSRAGRGPLSELIRTVIFPESMPASLGELVLGWETHFRLVHFLDHSQHYVRTFRAWSLAERAERARARALVGEPTARAFEQYFAVGEAIFRLREQALYRVILERAAVAEGVGRAGQAERSRRRRRRAGGRLDRGGPRALRRVERLLPPVARADADVLVRPVGPGVPSRPPWKRPWTPRSTPSPRWTGAAAGGRVLDVGCGWGYTIRRLVEHHGVARAVGLTPSAAAASPTSPPTPRRASSPGLERWEDHRPDAPYDAIVSFGAFEHFAPDGSRGPERIAAYRAFFERCWTWLVPGGRLGLETIAHDDAPDTDAPLGRGPLGDVVLGVYPESICPHLSEVVLGFEPWFEVEVLESAAGDFARTMQRWARNLRAHEAEAIALVGEDDRPDATGATWSLPTSSSASAPSRTTEWCCTGGRRRAGSRAGEASRGAIRRRRSMKATVRSRARSASASRPTRSVNRHVPSTSGSTTCSQEDRRRVDAGGGDRPARGRRSPAGRSRASRSGGPAGRWRRPWPDGATSSAAATTSR